MKKSSGSTAQKNDLPGRQRGFCGIALLVGLLAAILVIAVLEFGRLSPSNPPMRIISGIEAWNQAVGFAKTRIDHTERILFPVYNPAFIRQPSPGTWEVSAPLDLLDADGLPAGRKRFRVVERWEEKSGWTLLEFSFDR